MTKERHKIWDRFTINGEEYVVTKSDNSTHPCPGCQLGQTCGRTDEFCCTTDMPSHTHLKKWNDFETQWRYYSENWLEKEYKNGIISIPFAFPGPLQDLMFIENLLNGYYDKMITLEAKRWFLSQTQTYNEEFIKKFPFSTYFKEYINNINDKSNMEKNEIKIVVPEGMEVDSENSTFECIRFKPKKMVLYKDIHNKYSHPYSIKCRDNDLVKTMVFLMLLEVSDYLNDGWEPNWTEFANDDKYFIVYDPTVNKFTYGITDICEFHPAYFKSKEDVMEAIRIIGDDNLRKLLG